jgi:hypothetical protein
MKRWNDDPHAGSVGCRCTHGLYLGPEGLRMARIPSLTGGG